MAVICIRANKPMYPTRLEADIERARIAQMFEGVHRKRSHREAPNRSYQCEFCGHWHLTTQKKRGELESGS